MSREKQISPLVQKVLSIASEPIEALGGLTDHHLKYLVYLLTEHFKVKKYRIDVNYVSDPRVITLHVFDNNQQEVYLKAKNPNFFNDLVTFLAIPEYKIEFARRP